MPQIARGADFTSLPDGKWSVCVYCAARSEDPALLALATQLGQSIAERGWTVVSGGGKRSAMGSLAAAARRGNGRTIGVIPQALVQREVADVHADELVVTDTLRERKKVMGERADAFITLPGGIGTLEELFETWTAGYLGMHAKPVVILDPMGHYDGLFDWLEGLMDNDYVCQASLDRLVVVRDIESALTACAPPHADKSSERRQCGPQ